MTEALVAVCAQLINAALDISALFEARKDVISRATRFTSKAQPKKILDMVEKTVIAQLQGSVKRRGDSTRCASCTGHQQRQPSGMVAEIVWLRRMRATLAGSRGPVVMTVEVMSILPGLHLVDISKVTGDSVDFYDLYARLTDLIQPLITADALKRAESGARKRMHALPLCDRP